MHITTQIRSNRRCTTLGISWPLTCIRPICALPPCLTMSIGCSRSLIGFKITVRLNARPISATTKAVLHPAYQAEKIFVLVRRSQLTNHYLLLPQYILQCPRLIDNPVGGLKAQQATARNTLYSRPPQATIPLRRAQSLTVAPGPQGHLLNGNYSNNRKIRKPPAVEQR